MRSAQDLRREQGGIDVRLEREIDFVINECGLPREDAAEIAKARLGRPVPSLGRTRRPGPLVTSARREVPHQQVGEVVLRLGGGSVPVRVAQ